MATIVSLHSFRGGTGKSNTAANVATLSTADGRRVGVIDTDIQSPASQAAGQVVVPVSGEPCQVTIRL